MDDLLREFLTETNESLDTVDNQLVRFEQDPSDAKILDNIFRLVHTIKGTCGFLGLPRLDFQAPANGVLSYAPASCAVFYDNLFGLSVFARTVKLTWP